MNVVNRFVAPWEVVTPRQLVYLVLIIVFPTEILLLPPALIDQYGKDALWCIAIGGGAALVLALLVARAMRRLVDTTLEDVVIMRWGVAGRIVLLLFACTLLVPTYNIMASYVQVAGEELLPQTPLYVLALTSALVAAYIVAGGIETMARLASILVPIGFLLIALLFVMAGPWFNTLYLRPLLPTTPLVRLLGGSYHVFAFMAEIAFAFAIRPTRSTRLGGALVLAAALNFLLLVMMTAMPLMMFGPETAATMTSPALSAIRSIHYGFIVERMDILIAPVWVGFSLLKLTLWSILGTRLACAALGLEGIQRLMARLVTIAAGFLSMVVPDAAAVDNNLNVTWYRFLALLLLLLVGVVAFAVRDRRPYAPA